MLVYVLIDGAAHIDYYLYVQSKITNIKTLKNVQSLQGEGCAVCFSALGISSRMSIYRLLKQKGKATVSEIVEFIGLKQPTISYHLNEMKQAGILTSEKLGKEVYYSLSNECKIYHQECVLKDVKFPIKHV